MESLESGDIIQITDETHHWFPVIAVVDEPKAWGCLAYVLTPTGNEPGSRAATAYIRLKSDQFERTGGKAVIAPA